MPARRPQSGCSYGRRNTGTLGGSNFKFGASVRAYAARARGRHGVAAGDDKRSLP